jgi:DNA topoisomerase-2
MNRTITDFLNNELKEYANDIIKNRCIPSIVDSFKPTQRKIMCVSNNIWKIGNEKPVKVFSLVGSVSSLAYYHHGDSSCSEAICNMNQKFKNNLPMLEGIGQYGSLRSPFHAQDRYISTKLHPNFRLVYKDFELLENQIEEGVVVEPKWFLGIIPMIIVNPSCGIGMGYSSNILGRYPKDVIQACIDHLNGKEIKELKPWLSEFSGEWVRDKENKKKWYIHGKYEISDKKPEIHITELPPDITFEKYESYLDELVDNRTIRDYDNNSSSEVDYVLKFRKEDFDKIISDREKLEKLLKINDSVTENLTTLDENGKLKIFDCVEDILSYFVDFRMKYYHKRKEYFIGKWHDELDVMNMKANFIKAIIDKKITINNTPKDKIVSWLSKNGYKLIDDSYNYLLSMPIYSLTKERYEELLQKAKTKEEQIMEFMKKGIKEMYLEDLYELKKKIKS